MCLCLCLCVLAEIKACWSESSLTLPPSPLWLTEDAIAASIQTLRPMQMSQEEERLLYGLVVWAPSLSSERSLWGWGEDEWPHTQGHSLQRLLTPEAVTLHTSWKSLWSFPEMPRIPPGLLDSSLQGPSPQMSTLHLSLSSLPPLEPGRGLGATLDWPMGWIVKIFQH